MSRINVYVYADDDQDGKTLDGWFEEDSAERFAEAKQWSGENLISVPTGSQWDHQELYRTAQGRWVLGRYSNRQGTLPTYEFIDSERARNWLVENDIDGDNTAALDKYFGGVEEERGPGRPEVGPAFSLRFPAELLERVDQAAAADGVSRAEKIRRLVVAGLS